VNSAFVVLENVPASFSRPSNVDACSNLCHTNGYTCRGYASSHEATQFHTDGCLVKVQAQTVDPIPSPTKKSRGGGEFQISKSIG
jgi:hypothetical protein